MSDHRGYEMALSEADDRIAALRAQNATLVASEKDAWNQRDAIYAELTKAQAQNAEVVAALDTAWFFVASQSPSAFRQRALNHINAALAAAGHKQESGR